MSADIRWVREDEAFAKVLVREALSGNPEVFPRLVEAAAPFISHVAAILEAGAERGEVREDVPASQLALFFVGLGDLLLVQHWGSGGLWPPLDEIPEMVVRQFLEGAAPKEGTDP